MTLVFVDELILIRDFFFVVVCEIFLCLLDFFLLIKDALERFSKCFLTKFWQKFGEAN